MSNNYNQDNACTQLRALSCFQQIETVEPINAGLSSQCYLINADKQKFFAKQVSTANEALVCSAAAQLNLSPTVIFSNQHWLVTQFIEGENLTDNQQAIDVKIAIAIERMAQCHSLAAKPTLLAVDNIVDDLLSDPLVDKHLIDNTHYSNQQKSELLQLAHALTTPLHHALSKDKTVVCCHGDLNFSNLVVDQQNQTYLVDFECACSAPAEFDLAMFSAVNNLTANQLPSVIAIYQQRLLTTNSAIQIDKKLFYAYLNFCYLINGLWYVNAAKKSIHIDLKQALLKQATQQWQALNCSLKQTKNHDYSRLFSGLGIKF